MIQDIIPNIGIHIPNIGIRIVNIGLSTFIGYATNFIALKLLTNPTTAKSFLGFKLYGVVYKNKERIAENIAEEFYNTIGKNMKLSNLFTEDSFKEYIIEAVAQAISPYIKHDRITERMNKVLARAIVEHIDSDPNNIIKKKRQANISIDKESLTSYIRDSIMSIDNNLIKEKIETIAANEFKIIELTGAVIGLLIGIIQAILVSG